MAWRRRIFGFIGSVLAFDILAATVATHFVLNELTKLGVEVALQTRLSTTFYDILGMAPTLTPIFGIGLLIAFAVTGLVIRKLPAAQKRPSLAYAIAGFVSVMTALLAMEAVFGLWPIPAARSLSGLLALSVCGAIAGYIFARFGRQQPPSKTD
ncbi:MAG: hypothetical protein ACON41_04565 [Parvibaculales bacterium]